MGPGPERKARPDRATIALFTTLTLFAGVNAVGVKLLVTELDPFWAAGLRYTLAGLALVAIVVVTRRPLPRGDQLVGTAVFGVVTIGMGSAFYFLALQGAPAATVQVGFAVVPLLTLFLAVAHGVEPFRRLALFGGLIALVGTGIIFGDQLSLSVPLLSLLAIPAAAFCFAEAFIYITRHPPGDPVSAAAIGMLLGAAVLIGLAVVAGEQMVLPTLTETWLALGYLVVVGSVIVFVLLLVVLARWTASGVAHSFLIEPLVTVVVAAYVLGETVGPAFVIGGLLVVAGVYIGAFYRQRAAVQPSPAAP